jgi:hypothetical protein
MNEIETARLLTAAKVLDSRFVEPDDGGFVIRLWHRSLDDVPMEAAEEALRDYYRSSQYRETRDSISPADIVQWWRDRRRYAAVDRDRPPVDPATITAGVDRAVAELAATKAIRAGEDPGTALEIAEGDAGARRALRSVACPHCRARPGEPCTGPRGTPLVKTEAHDSRIQAATGRQVDVAPRNPTAAAGEVAGLRPADVPEWAEPKNAG